MIAEQQSVTEEQKAEWYAIHDRMSELHKAHFAALRQAGDFLRHALEDGDREVCLKLAWESAAEAIRFRDERAALSAEVAAHPYSVALAEAAPERG